MGTIEEYLHCAGISGTPYTRILEHVNTFQAQLQMAFAPANAGRILDALELMVELHIDQAHRPDGTLYIEHPLAVASQALEAMAHKDADVVVSALLHDIVEDQADKLVLKVTKKQTSEEQVEEQLALDAIEQITRSTRVRSIIAGLTNPDFDMLLEKRCIHQRTDNTDQSAYINARNILYVEHVRDAIQDPDVACIKIFDLAANALTLNTVVTDAI